MHAKLILIEGGKTVVVEPRLPTVIGRGTAADVRLPDSQTSRRHCELYEYEGQLAVRDLGSVNGTVVNQHKIEQDTLLSTGDTLTVGKITFQIDLGDGAPVALPGTEDDVVNIEPEESDSTVHSESAVLQYQATGEGSVIGVVEEEVEVVDDDDDGLGDFLKSLK
jgi:pSer/pThr/pTyr-binding forkhead associated (FHA) protein